MDLVSRMDIQSGARSRPDAHRDPSPVGGWLGLLCRVRLFVAAFGVAAGLSLQRRRPAAVTMARASLVLSAVADVFVYTTPYFPNNRPPGDTTLILTGSLLWYAAWLLYLWRSRRVRNTYPIL